MAVNNDGHLLDTSGNVAVDFVWGNFPLQPNDERAGSITPANIGGSTGDYGWSETTRVAATRLDFALDNHAIAESEYAGYPSFTGNNDGEYVSGVAYATVPNLVGLTQAAATDALLDAGLVLGTVSTTATGATAQNTGLVKTQSVAAGADSTALGTAVNITKYLYTA